MDLFKNPVGSLPTKGWLQVSQKTMIFDKILVFCCFSTVVVEPLVRQKLKFLNNSNKPSQALIPRLQEPACAGEVHGGRRL
jgi:hypothetical protein